MKRLKEMFFKTLRKVGEKLLKWSDSNLKKKRKRGRPKKSETEAKQKKKRGRPRKKKTEKTEIVTVHPMDIYQIFNAFLTKERTLEELKRIKSVYDKGVKEGFAKPSEDFRTEFTLAAYKHGFALADIAKALNENLYTLAVLIHDGIDNSE